MVVGSYLAGLIFVAVFSGIFIAMSIFKKHYLVNFAIFLLMLGGAYIVNEAQYSGYIWIEAGLLIVACFELYEMSKQVTGRKNR